MTADQTNDPTAALQKLVRQIRADSMIGKKKHFNAADRKDKLNLWCGLPPIVINIVLGSLLIGLLTESLPDWTKWGGALLAVVAAALTGVQTFFNWQKQVEGHKRIASKYLFLMKDATKLLAICETGAPADFEQRLEQLNTRYQDITLDAEAFGTNDDDYKLAIEGIKNGEEEYTAQELGLLESTSPLTKPLPPT